MFGPEGGKYPGVIATQDIKEREAILAIPFDQLVSVRRMSEELKNLMGQSSLFSESMDSEHLQLTLYLMDEYTKGKCSDIYEFI